MDQCLHGHPGSDGSEFRPIVVAPTYNHVGSLVGILGRIETLGLPILVVDDGSTDETADVLAAWRRLPRTVEVTVLTHDRNRGKASALLTGFSTAARLGYTHAATIDTDGQLQPEDLPRLLQAAAATPDALVLGSRSVHTPGLPKANLVGWYTSGLGLWLETGLAIRDSQCGLRVYPLRLTATVRCWTRQFGWETELIARAVWAGFPIAEVPAACHYASDGGHVSHLKPWREGFKGFFMHWGLAIRRLVPWPTPAVGSCRTGDRPGVSCTTSRCAPTGLRALRHWLSPLTIPRQVRSSRLEQLIATASFSHGVFFACLPLGIGAFPAAAYGSWRLRHNLWAALLGATLCLPPVGPAIAKLSIAFGHILLGFAWPDFTLISPGEQPIHVVLRSYYLTWPLGSLVAGTLLHWLTILVLLLLFRRFQVERR